MSQQEHWERVYRTKAPDAVSWYRPHLEQSVGFIERSGLPKDASIVDVGGGASTLVDDLLDRGYRAITVVDLSESAIATSRARLGERGRDVRWIVGDALALDLPPASVDFWHDRAVFHFLRDADDRRRYVETVLRLVRPGGFVLVATFGPHGPERCSGLEVARYDADSLHAEFGSPFVKVDAVVENHETPWGSAQEFVYCLCVARPTTG